MPKNLTKKNLKKSVLKSSNLLQWDFLKIYFKAVNELMLLPTAAYSNPQAKCWSAVLAAYYPALSLPAFMNEVCGVNVPSHAGMITKIK